MTTTESLAEAAQATREPEPELDNEAIWRQWVAFNESATKAGSGFTRDQMTGAAAFHSWLRMRAAATPPPPSRQAPAADLHDSIAQAIHDALMAGYEKKTLEPSYPDTVAARILVEAPAAEASGLDEIEERYWNGHLSGCLRRGGESRGAKTHDCSCGFRAALTAPASERTPDDASSEGSE